jgi:hypothetical protein
MTPAEQAIWQAAYAAEFVRGRAEHEAARPDSSLAWRRWLASRAVAVADTAVWELRRHRQEEDANAGTRLRGDAPLNPADHP